MNRKPYRIAVIPGDGIGKEVMPEALRALDAVSQRFGIGLEYTHIEWASCDYYAQHGQMMPDDWKAQLGNADAILFGAVGWPDTVPDHVSLWGSLLKFRREFDQYINLRPARLFDGVPSPLANRKPGDIDFMIVRENTEGEYSSVGGTMFEGTEREIVMQQSIFHAQRLRAPAEVRVRSRTAPRKEDHGGDEEQRHFDQHAVVGHACRPSGRALSRRGVGQAAHRHPVRALRAAAGRFDVVVATNLFGDILSDLGPACTGAIGIAPSGNLNPGRAFPSLFEPVHGSAPDIAGKNIANPVAMIWSAAMMLDFLGNGQGAEREAHDAMLAAIEAVLKEGPHTGDLGGRANTTEVGKAVAARLA